MLNTNVCRRNLKYVPGYSYRLRYAELLDLYLMSVLENKVFSQIKGEKVCWTPILASWAIIVPSNYGKSQKIHPVTTLNHFTVPMRKPPLWYETSVHRKKHEFYFHGEPVSFCHLSAPLSFGDHSSLVRFLRRPNCIHLRLQNALI